MQLFLKPAMKRASWTAIVIVVAVAALQMGGCYYMQAVNGQLEVLRKREPIAELLEDSTLPETTRQRLATVLDARRFAVEKQGDGKSAVAPWIGQGQCPAPAD